MLHFRGTEADQVVIGKFKVILSRVIGRGGFGTVYKAVDTNETGCTFAAKRIVSEAAAEKEQLMLERLSLGTLSSSHSNIIKIHDICYDKYKDLWIMMEFCEHGDLNRFAFSQPKKFEATKLDIMCQTASGLAYLHENDIVHRDIKPGNILLAEGENDSVIAKIADFALSKFFSPADDTTEMNTIVGTNYFKAPEICGGRVAYKRSIDIFSLGLTMLAMIQPISDIGLVPSLENTSLQETEQNQPIGQVIYLRQLYGLATVNVVSESATDDTLTKEIKQIIKRATFTIPENRIPADELHKQLNTLSHGKICCYLWYII